MLTLSSRQSPLAVAQAELVRQALLKTGQDVVEIKTSLTRGDTFLSGPLNTIKEATKGEVSSGVLPKSSVDLPEGKGLFVKEVQDLLLSKEADIAVHSLKDVPIEKTPGLRMVGVLPREERADVLLLSKELLSKNNIEDAESQDIFELVSLFRGKPIGTTSLRRISLLYYLYALASKELRGNINSRLKKLEEGLFSGIILAKAGLLRLGIFEQESFRTKILDPRVFVPSAGQGAIALEIREDDEKTYQEIKKIFCQKSLREVLLERLVLWNFKAGCHTTIGASCFDNDLVMVIEKQGRLLQKTYEFTSSDKREIDEILLSCDFETSFENLKKSYFNKVFRLFLFDKKAMV